MPKTATATKKAPAKKIARPAQDPDPLPDTSDWFVDLSDMDEFANILYYGREGSSKTTSAAFLANITAKGKVLFINAEGGLKKKALKKRGVNTDNIVVWPNPKKPEPITGTTLNAVFRRVRADLDQDPESWVGVVFDSASEIYQALLNVAQEKRINAAKLKGATVDEEFVDIADYGNMSKAFRDVLRKFRDLPCHFVVTALERRDVDKDTGKPQYGPAVTPGLASDLLGYVDFVIMMKAEDEDGPFRGLTRANSRYRAKDRFDVIPRVMAEPTFDRVLAYLNGEMDMDDPSTDPKQALLPKKAEKAQDKPDDDETDDDDDTEDDTDAT